MNGNPQGVPKPAPDLEVIRQEETPPVMKSVPVYLDRIAYVHPLPAKYASMHNVTVDQLATIPIPNELVPADPKLKRVWITCTAAAGNVVVGTQEQVKSITGPKGFPLPQNTPMSWEGFREPLYGIATVAGPFVVSLRFEYWAE